MDHKLFNLIEAEKQRQDSSIELIASENYVSEQVLRALGSCLTNKYSEGLPGKRYYGGNQVIDQIERLCQERALQLFSLSPEEWGVNVQSLSGSVANFAVYTGLLNPGDKIMGLHLPSGGHLSHGYMTPSGKRITAPSKYFTTDFYQVDHETGYLNYDEISKKVEEFQPDLLICGASAYPRDWDYAKFRQMADSVGAILMCDMAHISGLVAKGVN